MRFHRHDSLPRRTAGRPWAVRVVGGTAAVLATAVLVAAPLRAEDPRWQVRFDDARSRADAERLLDRLERAFSEVLEAAPEATELRRTAERLVATREIHTRQAAALETARARVEEARARHERDERLILERRRGAAFEGLTAAEQAALTSREEQYLGRILTVTANREAEAERLASEIQPTRTLLSAYAGSWGGLALERAIIEPQRITRLSGGSWHRAMQAHAVRFNSYAQSRFATADCLAEAPGRPLLSHRISTATLPTGVRERDPAAARPWIPAAPDDGRGAVTPYVRPAPERDVVAEGRGFDPVFPTTEPKPVVAPPAPYRASAGTEVHGGFVWYHSFEEAAAEARRTGRLIYCLSTKPDCHMCEAVRDESLPANLADMQRLCVGYLYNILNPTRDPEVSRVDRFLRSHLVGYSMMPLTGWVTPDLQWVHGFHGWKTAEDFRRELRQAQAAHR